MNASNSESTKMNDTAKHINDLSPAKLALLARRLKAKREGSQQAQLIPLRRDGGDFAPLSFAQERLWFIDQLNPGRPGFNLYGSFRNKGRVNPEAYQQALTEIVRRQEVLRTTFPAIDGKPVQAIARPDISAVPTVDLSGLSDDEQKAMTRQVGSQERSQPFNLAKQRPLRAKLVVLRSDESMLLLTVHHIVADAWSWDELLSEMLALYKDFSNGVCSSLLELPIQYADYAQWQRQAIQGEALEKQLSYWKEQLGGDPPLVELPTDRPRASRQIYIGRRQGITLGRQQTEAIKALSQREGVTLFMTLLAIFYALLYRYTGHQDISVGAVISNRNRSQVERLIGLFINTLVLRAKLDGRLPFRELIRRVRQLTTGAYAHADLPIEKLLEALQPKRETGLAPMFRIMFGLDSASLSGDLGSLSDLDVQRTDGLASPGFEPQKNAEGLEWMDIDLGLSIQELGDELYVGVRYNSTLFEATTVVRMLRHFQSLVESVAADPDQQVGDLQLLTAAERQLLQDWNNTEADDTQAETFLDLFEAQQGQTPGAVAVVSEDEHVTYGELNRRANRLAHRFESLGLGQERLLGVAARRGIDFLTCMLAAFKAGAAYLPLDPFDPSRRLRQVLNQSKPDLMVASDEFIDDVRKAASEGRSPVISIEALLRGGSSEADFRARCLSRNCGYVIYTSGSTGLPKGAMVEHRGLLNHLRAKVADLQLTCADVVAQTASQSFDISVWQFLAALLVGGRVRIIDDETAHDPFRLLGLIEREAVTILETIPSLLGTTVEEMTGGSAPPHDLSSLRWLLITGEALPPDLCHQWMSLYPDLPLLNAYGPTECSDDVTHYAVTQRPPVDMIHMPIGRPVRNMQMRLLDGMGMQIPVGVLGELFVGGVGVGRGYLHDPAKSAEMFIPDPFSTEPGARLYKTGDLVRYLPDGNIEFRGRLDHQVKVRGFRIEPAEVEAVLGAHPALQHAVVLAREDKPGDKRLVAYVVSAQQPSPLPNDLRDFLQDRLPDYMVPSAFVILDRLPLTQNGKIDRLALPAPDEEHLVEADEFVAPESNLEKRLAEIWSEILEIDQIGIYSNFFHLGGHSLMAIQVINRINQNFNVNLSVRNIFEDPTVAGLALLIEEKLIEALEGESD